MSLLPPPDPPPAAFNGCFSGFSRRLALHKVALPQRSCAVHDAFIRLLWALRCSPDRVHRTRSYQCPGGNGNRFVSQCLQFLVEKPFSLAHAINSVKLFEQTFRAVV
jgi:hypothetical protein